MGAQLRETRELTANLAGRTLQRSRCPLGGLQLLLQLLLPGGSGAQVCLQSLRATVQGNHLQQLAGQGRSTEGVTVMKGWAGRKHGRSDGGAGLGRPASWGRDVLHVQQLSFQRTLRGCFCLPGCMERSTH